jgi:OmpA-OmpF porin, OOP family
MKSLIKLLFVVVILSMAGYASAQIDIKGKIKDKVNSRANSHVDNTIDKGLDAVEKGVSDSVTEKDEDKANDEEANQEEVVESEEPSTQKELTQQKQEKVALQSFSKYDFVPGDKVLFFEDFSQDAVGDFPALWTTNGSGEVKTVNIAAGNWLHMNAADAVYCLIPETKLPENFIFECDVIAAPREEGGNFSFQLSFFNADDDYRIDDLYPGNNGVQVEFNYDTWNVKSYAIDKDWKDGSSSIAPLSINELNHIIIWVQKGRLRIYHKGQKTVDLPTVLYTPTNYNRLRFSLWGQEGAPYVTNIRFTTAGADNRSKLLTEGKIVSYGIYFDVNKDVVKPESYGALNEISKILKENPDIRVRIIGFTDSDGNDASNLDLSKRRAAAVKNELTKSFGIEASQLETDGKGETEAIAPNDTPSNKALNRRVEFIKL